MKVDFSTVTRKLDIEYIYCFEGHKINIKVIALPFCIFCAIAFCRHVMLLNEEEITFSLITLPRHIS